ncbi:MAG: hypothetical protein KC621_32765 [Myxococcales bacterium]|nr:hypothetical protein [Myxococcales bacterium]
MSADPLLGELLSDTRDVVRRLMDEPLSTPGGLVSQLDLLAEELSAEGKHLRADLEAGIALVARARTLLERWAELDHRGRRLVQVAVRYLAMEDDGDGDLTSAFGFDDDEEVIDAVERALGGRR